jgi:hypothetical protein
MPRRESRPATSAGPDDSRPPEPSPSPVRYGLNNPPPPSTFRTELTRKGSTTSAAIAAKWTLPARRCCFRTSRLESGRLLCEVRPRGRDRLETSGGRGARAHGGEAAGLSWGGDYSVGMAKSTRMTDTASIMGLSRS